MTGIETAEEICVGGDSLVYSQVDQVKVVTFHQSDDFPELSVPAMMLYQWDQGPSTVHPLLLTDQLLAREFERSPIKSYKLTEILGALCKNLMKTSTVCCKEFIKSCAICNLLVNNYTGEKL